MKQVNEHGPKKSSAHVVLFGGIFLIGALYALHLSLTNNTAADIPSTDGVTRYSITCPMTEKYEVIVKVALIDDVLPADVNEDELVENACNSLINNGTVMYGIIYQEIE